MAMRDDLRRLVDELPEADVPVVLRMLRGLRAIPATGPDLAAILDAAPADDEPVTDDDRAASEQARRELASGEGLSPDDVRRMIGT